LVVAFTAAVAVALAVPSFASALSLQETAQSPLPNMTGVNAIATGDFNEDGLDDMAVADESGVVIWLSNGDGTFTEGETLPIETQINAIASAVVVGDFNGDGNLDVAYTDGPYKLHIALGNGNGTFEPADASTTFSLPFYVGGANQMAVGNFTGGTADEIVLDGGIHNASFEEAGYQVIGDELGTFVQHAKVPVSIPFNSQLLSVAVGDFNDDGDQDLALLAQPFEIATGNDIYEEEGNGDGSFAEATNSPIALSGSTYGYAYTETSANLDGTGGDDLLVNVSHNYSTLPLLGSSTEFLTLNAAGALENGASLPISVAAADLTGDGLDAAISTYFNSQGTVGVGLSDGAGKLSAALGSPFRVSQSGFWGSSIAVGDFNGDGYPDVAIGSNSNPAPTTQGVAVLMNSAAFEASSTNIEFGTVKVGESAIETVTLTGLGGPAAEVSDIELEGAAGSPFALVDASACERGIEEGEECAVEVAFTPTAEEASTDTLSFTTDTGPGGAPVTSEVPLSGEGLAPVAGLSPASQDFGSVQIGGTPVTKTFTIGSTGDVPLSVSGISLSSEADFTLGSSTGCVKTIDPGGTCKVSVTFSPTGSAGARTATLTVATDAGTKTAQLSGTATAAASSGGGGSTDGQTTTRSKKAKLKVKAPATAKAGKTIRLKVTITNSGDTALSGLALTVKVPAKLAVAPKSVKVGSLGVGKSVTETIKVKVKPSAAKGSKIAVELSVAAGGKTLAKASGKVKVK